MIHTERYAFIGEPLETISLADDSIDRFFSTVSSGSRLLGSIEVSDKYTFLSSDESRTCSQRFERKRKRETKLYLLITRKFKRIQER